MASNATAERKIIMVARIEQKPTTKGKDMWRIIDDHDDFYSIFDEFVRGRIVEGKHNAVMVKVEQRAGKSYKNIVGIADGPVAEENDVSTNDLLPGGAAPPSSQNLQQSPAPVPTQNTTPPPATTRPPAPTPAGPADQMADIRAKGLELAVSMFNANRITHEQIEANANTFVGYIAGEQNSSSKGRFHDEYAA